MILKLSSNTTLTNYKVLSNAVIPRPIAWVSTVDSSGVVNLAPFSFFAPVCNSPVILSICMSKKGDGDTKDTLRNIENSRVASVSTVQTGSLTNMIDSAKELPFGVSEASQFGIEMQVVDEGYPPVVKSSKAAFLCKLHDVLNLGASSSTVLLRAELFFIDDSIYDQSLNFSLDNVGRIGREYIGTLSKIRS